jgi:two-component system secretion response regulator SsrB
MPDAFCYCVLLAERHPGLVERVRGLLATRFDVVVSVADERSLLESAERLRPMIAVVDLSLPLKGKLLWIRRLRDRCPGIKLVLLSVYDEPGVRRAATEAGADGFVLKRSVATDLLPTVESLLEGRSGSPSQANGTDPRRPPGRV